jgi:hypothetical protein
MTTVTVGSPQTFTLPAGYALTVVAGATSSGRIFPFSESVGDTSGLTDVAASATVTLGPFSTVKRYLVETLAGTLAVTSALVDFPTAAESLAAAVAAVAAVSIPVTGTIGDTGIYVGAGAPVDYTDGSPAATGEGVAGIGSLYIDTTAGKLYVQKGTKAEPLWGIVTSA